ncbi:MAG: hypothetical protein HUJ63_14005 [Enterococcus sp.]|nr:hypothetical protein [Enterococcus sp.]
MAETRDIVYDITESIGVITKYSTGWTKEINRVSWNDGSPKIDIRDWSADHEHMSRGITLHDEEAEKLADYIKGYLSKKK